MHVSNLFYTEPMTRLAQRLSESSLGGRVFFCNSGTEANEAAIKVARKHAHGRGITAPEIVSFEGEFHGRSYGALSATPKLARNEALGPYLPGFVSVPDNDAEALRAAVGPNTAAVLIEPIQGESGVWPTSDEALLAAREACDAVGALLIFDEIQTGIGRTGSLWAYEQTPVRPDVITSAKALGGGMPIGACITGPEAAEALQPGDHGSTFAAGPIGDQRRARGARRGRRSGAAALGAGAGRAAAERARGAARGRRHPRPGADGRRRAGRRGSTPPRSAPTCWGAASSSTSPRRARSGCCRRWWSSPARSTGRLD